MLDKYLDKKLLSEIEVIGDEIYEIRIRLDRNILILHKNGEYISSVVADYEYISSVYKKLLSNSAYALRNEITKGYITIENGCRVGFCGKCIIDKNEVNNITEINSVNFRIANDINVSSIKSIKGFLDKNILIVGPPGSGKTTLLRDLLRKISYEKNVSVIDERCELFPMYNNKFVFDMGNKLDVMRNCEKSAGFNMVLRAMNPSVIAFDEFEPEKELKYILSGINSGINIITSLHAGNLDDVKEKVPDYNLFDMLIFMSKEKHIGEIKDVICLS